MNIFVLQKKTEKHYKAKTYLKKTLKKHKT